MAKTVVGYESALPEIPDREPWEAPTAYLVKGTLGRVRDRRRPPAQQDPPGQPPP